MRIPPLAIALALASLALPDVVSADTTSSQRTAPEAASPETASLEPAAPEGALEEANVALVRAGQAGRAMLSLLDETRRSGDRRKTRCVDAALSQINSFAMNLRQRRDRLRSALGRGDRAEAAHQRRVIRRVMAQVQARHAAGRACVYGEVPTGRGVTVVEVIVDREVPRHADLSADAADRGRRWWDGARD